MVKSSREGYIVSRWATLRSPAPFLRFYIPYWRRSYRKCNISFLRLIPHSSLGLQEEVSTRTDRGKHIRIVPREAPQACHGSTSIPGAREYQIVSEEGCHKDWTSSR